MILYSMYVKTAYSVFQKFDLDLHFRDCITEGRWMPEVVGSKQKNKN